MSLQCAMSKNENLRNHDVRPYKLVHILTAQSLLQPRRAFLSWPFIAGMCEAAGRRQPASAKLPLYIVFV